MQESESQEITHLEQYHVNMDWTSHVATQSDNNLINLTPRTFEMFFFFFFFCCCFAQEPEQSFLMKYVYFYNCKRIIALFFGPYRFRDCPSALAS